MFGPRLSTGFLVTLLAFAVAPALAQNTVVRDPSAVIMVPERGGPTHVQVPPGSQLPQGMTQDTPGEIQRGRRAEAEAQAGAITTADAVGMMTEAERAARSGDIRLANEIAERVETRLLTGTTVQGAESMPSTGGVIGKLQQGRAALARRDPSQAATLFAEAAALMRATRP